MAETDCTPLLGLPKLLGRGTEVGGDEDKQTHIEDSKKTPVQENREKEIRTLLTREEHSNWDTFWLMYYWARSEIPFYVEILALHGLLYYADMVLDMKSILIFFKNHQEKYGFLNLSAVLTANFYTFLQMYHHLPESDDRSMVFLIGFLMPFFGHMALLCLYSLRIRKRHQLLASGKLAEAAIEASLSAMVQTYALIFTDWSDKVYEFYTVGLSVLSSFFCIGLAFTDFDRKETGLYEQPGIILGGALALDGRRVLIQIARVAEVTSRITSVALFSVATRDLLDLSFMDDWDGPWSLAAAVMQNIFITLGPALLMLDFLVLLALITWYQQTLRPMRAILSVLSFINPLLEKGNPFTVPAFVYYGWRLVMLLFMSGGTCYVTGMHSIQEKLNDDLLIIKICVISTFLWLLLVLTIRYFLAKHAFLVFANEEKNTALEIFGSRLFNEDQDQLMKRLLKQTQCHGEFKKLLNDGTKLIRELKEAGENVSELFDGDQVEVPAEKLEGSFGLFAWGKHFLEESAENRRSTTSLETVFEQVLILGANLLPSLRDSVGSPGGFPEELQFLKAINDAMSREPVVRISLKYMKALRERVLHVPPSLREGNDNELYNVTVEIVGKVGEMGWDKQGSDFLKDSDLLQEFLGCLPRPLKSKAMTTVLVRIWSKAMQKSNTSSRPEVHNLFKKRKQWQEIVEMIEELDKWPDEYVVAFCEAGSEILKSQKEYASHLPREVAEDIRSVIQGAAKKVRECVERDVEGVPMAEAELHVDWEDPWAKSGTVKDLPEKCQDIRAKHARQKKYEQDLENMKQETDVQRKEADEKLLAITDKAEQVEILKKDVAQLRADLTTSEKRRMDAEHAKAEQELQANKHMEEIGKNSRALEGLIELLHTGSAVAKEKAAGALWILTVEHAENKATIGKNSRALAGLTELLHTGSADAKEEAAGALRALGKL